MDMTQIKGNDPNKQTLLILSTTAPFICVGGLVLGHPVGETMAQHDPYFPGSWTVISVLSGFSSPLV